MNEKFQYSSLALNIVWHEETLTCIDLFNDIEISLIVGVFDTASAPWNSTQLARRKRSTDTKKKNQRKWLPTKGEWELFK